MGQSTIRFSLEGGIARLTLDRPAQLNAFNKQMHAEVSDALNRIEASPDTRVLLLTGAGRGFCAGQDLGERKRVPGDPPYDLGVSIATLYGPLVRRLAALPAPVICAVNGVAAGAGVNIALACDLVIAKSSARFIQSFIKIGLLPDSGGTWSLPRKVGETRALGLALTGEPLDAETAAAWGMIWRAVPDDVFDHEVEALVQRMAAAPTLAAAAVKQAIRATWSHDFAEQIDLERDLQRGLGLSQDYAEGVAAFSEKRSPAFRGA